jgi:hypothetical protein
VLVCSSILGEFVANYHRERMLARSLASEGIGTVRFHYSGEGNSQGDREGMTFETLVDDAGVAAEFTKSLGFTRLGLVGTRMGSLIAAATAASMAATVPLALWEPLDDPLRFITDGLRAKRISQLAQEGGGGSVPWMQELEQNGRLDLLGYDVYPSLVASFRGLDLLTALSFTQRPLFIARFRQSSSPKDRLVQELTERGFTVQTGHYGLTEAWWFDHENQGETGEVVVGTVNWLKDGLGE